MSLALSKTAASNLALELLGTPLSVVFADGDAIAAARDGAAPSIALAPPFHVSDEDAYLVLPEDIGIEILDILRDGDEELLREAMRDSLLVSGSVESTRKGEMSLFVDECVTAADALKAVDGYAERYALKQGVDAVQGINRIGTFACTVASQCIDDDSLEQMLREEEFIGTSWRVPEGAPAELHGDPTFAWARKTRRGTVGVEFLLFQEYDELVAFLRPLEIAVDD